jgi:hypothetical protein
MRYDERAIMRNDHSDIAEFATAEFGIAIAGLRIGSLRSDRGRGGRGGAIG